MWQHRKSLLILNEERCNYLASPKTSLSMEFRVKTALPRSWTPCHGRCVCHHFKQKIEWQLVSPAPWSNNWLHDTDFIHCTNTDELLLCTKCSSGCCYTYSDENESVCQAWRADRYTSTGLEIWLCEGPAMQAWELNLHPSYPHGKGRYGGRCL